MRMTAVTLACLMILMRPFIQFFSVASVVAFCALWSMIIGGQFQPAGAFAFWSVALGAIPANLGLPLGLPCARHGLEHRQRLSPSASPAKRPRCLRRPLPADLKPSRQAQPGALDRRGRPVAVPRFAASRVSQVALVGFRGVEGRGSG